MAWAESMRLSAACRVGEFSSAAWTAASSVTARAAGAASQGGRRVIFSGVVSSCGSVFGSHAVQNGEGTAVAEGIPDFLAAALGRDEADAAHFLQVVGGHGLGQVEMLDQSRGRGRIPRIRGYRRS
jgi:hypothetical protein